MKHLTAILFLLHLFFYINAQQPNDNIQIEKKIAGNYISFSVDNLDNIYLLNATNQLKKLDAKGDSISVFNDIKKYGEATLVDVSNPLKILLYYKGFATIVVLDGMLNLKNTIDLRKKNIFNVTAVSLSYDGKIWLYDEVNNALKKIDDDGSLLFTTTDFRQLFDKVLAPVKIFDQNKYIYLYDSLQGIYVFDYYGSFKNKIDITSWNHLRISNQYIYGSAKNSLYRYNIDTFKQDESAVPTALQDYKSVFLKGKKLYALNKDGLEIYSIKNEALFFEPSINR